MKVKGYAVRNGCCAHHLCCCTEDGKIVDDINQKIQINKAIVLQYGKNKFKRIIV